MSKYLMILILALAAWNRDPWSTAIALMFALLFTHLDCKSIR